MGSGRRLRGKLLDRLPAPLLHAALLVALWPGAARPFSTPKLWVLAAGAGALLGLAALRPLAAGNPRGPEPLRARPAAAALGLAWLALCALSGLAADAARPEALLLDAGAAVLLLALVRGRTSAAGALPALASLGALLAAVVLLQDCGLDPLSALSPGAPGRLRAYGTLGNPDFAAAWLGAALWLALGAALRARTRRLRLAFLGAAALQLAALACARSFGSLLALAAGAAACAVALGPGRKGLLRAGAALAAGALLLLPGVGGRDPSAALAGRLYLWRTGAAHLAEAPLLGRGPGSVELLQPLWEADRWARGLEAPEARRFAGRQDHLHQDLLERALEQGVPAALAFAALCALGLLCAIRGGRRRPELAGLAAALASLCARGLFDFPAARPAELALLVTLIACAVRLDPLPLRAPRPRALPLPAPEAR